MVLKVSLNTGINRIRLEFKVYPSASEASVAVFVLIESDWNLKQNNKEIADIVAERINRIRLEFKDDNFKLIYNTRKAVLIESDWNLKD